MMRYLFPLLLTALSVAALSADDWAKQSIYQVMVDRFARTDGSTTASCDLSSYCGGSWQGLINKLDYIQGMGFTAVWISPIVTQISASGSADGDSYHGYWAKDFNNLNSHFGTASDLTSLSTALHNRGMYLMVDIVTNHMAYPGCRTCVDYSTLSPFSSSSYYHTPCDIDYSNTTSVQQCWEGDNIVSLPDLRTEDQTVRNFFDPWIAQLVSTYKIDGLRIDSAKHQETSFWPTFSGNSTVYMVGEVYDGDPDVVIPFLSVFPGVLNYPVWYWLQRAFESTSATMSELNTGIANIRGKTTKTNYLGSFSENHDQPRMPAWSSQSSDISLIKNAIAFMMLMDGIPIVYQGQEQKLTGGTVPANREAIWLTGYNTQADLYLWITQINKFRSAAISINSGYVSSQATSWTPTSYTIALQKGPSGYPTVSVFNNIGSSGSSYSVSLASSNTGFSTSQQVVDIIACTSYTTDSSGNLAFTMTSLPKVFYRLDRLTGSGICPSLTGGTTSKSSTSTTLVTTRTSSTAACSTPTSVAVSFTEKVTTSYGQTIKIVGNVAALGNWDTSSAVALSASSYTTSNPIWTGTISLPAGTTVQYKYINVASSGTVIWEADPNHTLTVPAACGTTALSVSDTWQS